MQSKNDRRSKGRRTARSGFQRTRYYKPLLQGTNFVLLDPDVASVFREPESVNEALRSLMKLAGQIGLAPLRPFGTVLIGSTIGTLAKVPESFTLAFREQQKSKKHVTGGLQRRAVPREGRTAPGRRRSS